MHTNKLVDIVIEYKDAYHKTIKMKPAVVNSKTYAVENYDENSKFEFGDHMRILKHKSILAKDFTSNWSEKDFVIKNVKNTLSWTYIIEDLNREEIVKTFKEKNRREKILMKKFDEICWSGKA